MTRVKAEFNRTPGNVFVSVKPPENSQQAAAAQPRVWAKVADAIGVETPVDQPDTAVSNKHLPTAEELLETHLPAHIEASRWGFYVIPSRECRVFDGTVFVYRDPAPPFWNLYRLAKGIFRDIGVLLTKHNGVWEARIPIAVLTDKIFVESGLAGVEQTMRRGTEAKQSFASQISDGLRKRQLQNTKRGLQAVNRIRQEIREGK